MTYDAFQSSVESSQPVETYRITQGAVSFFYTSGPETVTLDLIDYVPVAGLERGTLSYGSEERQAQLEVRIPGNNEFVRQYTSIVPGQRAKLELTRHQYLDGGTPEVILLFSGYVSSVTFIEEGRVATMTVVPDESALSGTIPRFVYSGLCNNVLYDDHGSVGCRVDDTDPAFRHTGTVTDIDGDVITVTGVTGFPDGFFTAGFVEASNGLDHRLILDHVGNDLTLLLPFSVNVLGVGDSVDVLAGCDHSAQTCNDKFDNLVNFGGFPYVPTINPFQHGLV